MPITADLRGQHLCLLGYGRAGDFAAIRHSRRLVREPRQVSRGEVRRFEAYARMLAGKYAYLGSGADEQDVQQVAVIAAWKALEEFDSSGPRGLEPFVKERMRWRVIDFVRVRGDGQHALERWTTPLAEEDC